MPSVTCSKFGDQFFMLETLSKSMFDKTYLYITCNVFQLKSDLCIIMCKFCCLSNCYSIKFYMMQSIIWQHQVDP